MRLDRRRFLAGGCACCATAAAGPLRAQSTDGSPQALELGTEPMTRISRTLWVAKLSPKLWLHTTTGVIEGGAYYPANGLVLERPGGALLIDTGWLPEHGEALLDWSRRTLREPITTAVATHFHRDRTGGIPGLSRRGVTTFGHPATSVLASSHGLPAPEPLPGFESRLRPMGAGCDLYFPGAGHSADNIVAWLGRQKTLFGGCFLKSSTSRGLGNLDDADLPSWREALKRVQARFPDIQRAVPGHGTISGDALARTRVLLARA